VSSDSLNYSKKNKYPEFSQQERMEIIGMIKGVDEVFSGRELGIERFLFKRIWR
jgi:glycerol-3-phosphate cytidylyltransferase